MIQPYYFSPGRQSLNKYVMKSFPNKSCDTLILKGTLSLGKKELIYLDVLTFKDILFHHSNTSAIIRHNKA